MRLKNQSSVSPSPVSVLKRASENPPIWTLKLISNDTVFSRLANTVGPPISVCFLKDFNDRLTRHHCPQLVCKWERIL